MLLVFFLVNSNAATTTNYICYITVAVFNQRFRCLCFCILCQCHRNSCLSFILTTTPTTSINFSKLKAYFLECENCCDFGKRIYFCISIGIYIFYFIFLLSCHVLDNVSVVATAFFVFAFSGRVNYLVSLVISYN